MPYLISNSSKIKMRPISETYNLYKIPCQIAGRQYALPISFNIFNISKQITLTDE